MDTESKMDEEYELIEQETLGQEQIDREHPIAQRERIEDAAPLSVQELLSTDWGKTKYIIPNLLPAGLAILGGDPKIGKSYLALQIAIAVGSGGEIFGEEVDKSPVLYVAYEDTFRRLKERVQKQGVTDPNEMLD